MPKREAGKPKGRMSSYAYFVQCCREEHKKKHPGENVVFAEFTRKCADKWKEMTPKEKHRFEDMAEKDKGRYEKEMSNYTPAAGVSISRGKKRTKDPNAPKRPLSAFFLFCNEERPKVRAIHPEHTVGEVAKELGKRWEKVTDRSKFERLAAVRKGEYEVAMEAYKASQGLPAKKGGPARAPAAKKPKVVVEESDEEEDEEEEEEEEEDDDDDE